MQDRRSFVEATVLKWTIFLVLLVALTGWAIRRVLARAQQMRTADTSASTFNNIAPGLPLNAVLRLDQVNNKELKGMLLMKDSDTLYLRPPEGAPAITAILTPAASVVIGKPQDIVPGAIVQIAGTIDENHVLRTNEVAILTRYVRLSQGSR